MQKSVSSFYYSPSQFLHAIWQLSLTNPRVDWQTKTSLFVTTDHAVSHNLVAAKTKHIFPSESEQVDGISFVHT